MICAISFEGVCSSEIKTASNHNWKMIKKVKGITIYSAEVDGEDVVAFRGDTIIDHPIERIVSALGDMKRKTTWMHDLKEIKTVEQYGPLNNIQYYHSGTPWPLSDRDFLFLAEGKYFKNKRMFVLNMRNIVRNDVPPRKGIVRGRLLESNYFISKTDDNNKTALRVEILVDPMGLVPKWVVNIFQRAWPKNTLTGLKRLMDDKTFPTNPKLLKFFKKQI